MHNYAVVPGHKTIHSSVQLADNGVRVDDRSPTEGGTLCLTTTEGYKMPLAFRRGLPYLAMRPFTDDEYATLPHVHLTSGAQWNPSVHDIEVDDSWYSETPNAIISPPDSPYDTFGETRDLAHLAGRARVEAHLLHYALETDPIFQAEFDFSAMTDRPDDASSSDSAMPALEVRPEYDDSSSSGSDSSSCSSHQSYRRIPGERLPDNRFVSTSDTAPRVTRSSTARDSTAAPVNRSNTTRESTDVPVTHVVRTHTMVVPRPERTTRRSGRTNKHKEKNPVRANVRPTPTTTSRGDTVPSFEAEATGSPSPVDPGDVQPSTNDAGHPGDMGVPPDLSEDPNSIPLEETIALDEITDDAHDESLEDHGEQAPKRASVQTKRKKKIVAPSGSIFLWRQCPRQEDIVFQTGKSSQPRKKTHVRKQ